MGDQGLETRRANHKMDVGGSIGMPTLGFEHLADRAIIGDRIIAGGDAAKPELAIGIRPEAGAQIQDGRCLARALDIIHPIGIGLPGIDPRPRDRRAGGIPDAAFDDHGVALALCRNIGAERHFRWAG